MTFWSILAIVLAVALLAVVAVLIFARVTGRLRWSIEPDDDEDADDLSDDTATLLSILPVTSIVVDRHDEVVRSSPSAYRLGLVSDDAIVNTRVLEEVRAIRTKGGKSSFDITTQTPERFVQDAKPSDDAQLATRTNWLNITVGGIGEHFVVVLVNDESDTVRFAETRDAFIANVSEQLLEPTKALDSLADSLESNALDGEVIARDAKQVRSSSNKLHHMVDDLLLLIKAQEPVTPSDANLLNVMECLHACEAKVQAEAQQLGVTLVVKGDDTLTVNGDADQIDSALVKLAENAIRYSKSGGTVSMTAAKSQDGSGVVIRVVDQGAGIAKADQTHIFERFYRGAAQNDRTQDGVGLGLAIVKHVALTHHGEVSVWSAPGQGSTFTLALPLAKPRS